MLRANQEFENENTLTYNTNSSSRSEFPIFRAITPLNIGHHHLNASNSSESAVIIDNRTPPNDVSFFFFNTSRTKCPILIVFNFNSIPK